MAQNPNVKRKGQTKPALLKKRGRGAQNNEQKEEWLESKHNKIRKSLKNLRVIGREKETDQITEFIFDASREFLYIYGVPGSGKTYLVKQISEVLGVHGLETYYTNLLMDTEFFKTTKRNSPTVLLVVDEFEGKEKDKLYLKQKAALETRWRKEKRKVLPKTKTLFISNAQCNEGIRFTPYTEEDTKEILISQGTENNPMVLFQKIHESRERADLRVGLNTKLQNTPTVQSTPVGQYHQFIKEKIAEGITDQNAMYRMFIPEMKKRDVPIIPKELFKDILDSYTDGG